MDIFHLSPLHWSNIQTAIAHMNVELPGRGQASATELPRSF